VNRLLAVLVSALVLAFGAVPVAAQPRDDLIPCTEVLAGVSIVIGHDCGEWASIVIVGNIVIHKPWSQAIPASRAARIRERGNGRPVVSVDPTRTPRRERASATERTSRPERTPEADCHPAYGGCLPIVEDLDCPEIDDLQVQLVDPQEDPYGLDVARGVGNGITCDDES
jgi:hypothetical protein